MWRIRGGISMPKHFGDPPDVAVGTGFKNRQALRDAEVHAPLMAGISGTQAEGADSIVVSGGYLDDADYGDVIIYTGHGGNDPQTKRQIADQDVAAHGNAGLITSQLQGLPVRVIRGAGGHSQHAPAVGFRYDGLYRVTDHWTRTGAHGFRLVQFRLERFEDQPEVPLDQLDLEGQPVALRKAVIQRQIRSTATVWKVKALHDDGCQVCGERLVVNGGTYSEGAHIRALGRPHLGPDTLDNILCLCPNHHVRLDYGGLYLSDDLTVIDADSGAVIGPLRTHPMHRISLSHIRYHRGLWTT